MTAVVFDYSLWASSFPTVAAYTPEAIADVYFDIATTLCDNGDCSPVPYNPPTTTVRQTALNLLVAHIGELASPARGGLVGRISSATQGSVSVATELNVSKNAAWFSQTQWGLLFWQMTAAYRAFMYVPGPQPFAQPRPFRV